MGKLSEIIEELAKGFAVSIKGRVNEKSHSKLYDAIHSLAKSKNIPAPRNIFIVQEPFGMPNAGMGLNDTMLVGEKLLEAFNYSESVGHISNELKAVIGHELGHSTRIKKDLLMVHAPMLVGPLIIYAGYKLYEYAKHRKEEKGGGLNQHIEIAAKEIEQGLSKKIDAETATQDSSITHKIKKLVVWAVKDSAVMIGATLLMIPVAKLTGRHVEFAADRFAGELVGNEHMISALNILKHKGSEAMTKAGFPEALQTLLKAADYHPSTEARIAHLTR